VLLESGSAREAEPLARAALEQFKKEQQVSAEISAHDTLAETLLELGKVAESNSEILLAEHLSAKSESRAERLKTEIANARVISKANPEDGARKLRTAVQEAEQAGLLGRQLEATLALGEVEIKSGKKDAGKARLQALEKDAKGKGFVLIAQRAGDILK